MSCDVKPLMVRFMCLSMYWIHTTVIRRDRSRDKMIPKIIFIPFVNLIMNSPSNIFLAFKEWLDYLENDLEFLGILRSDFRFFYLLHALHCVNSLVWLSYTGIYYRYKSFNVLQIISI